MGIAGAAGFKASGELCGFVLLICFDYTDEAPCENKNSDAG
jgi:hypothetical protein